MKLSLDEEWKRFFIEKGKDNDLEKGNDIDGNVERGGKRKSEKREREREREKEWGALCPFMCQ